MEGEQGRHWPLNTRLLASSPSPSTSVGAWCSPFTPSLPVTLLNWQGPQSGDGHLHQPIPHGAAPTAKSLPRPRFPTRPREHQHLPESGAAWPALVPADRPQWLLLQPRAPSQVTRARPLQGDHRAPQPAQVWLHRAPPTGGSALMGVGPEGLREASHTPLEGPYNSPVRLSAQEQGPALAQTGAHPQGGDQRGQELGRRAPGPGSSPRQVLPSTWSRKPGLHSHR